MDKKEVLYLFTSKGILIDKPALDYIVDRNINTVFFIELILKRREHFLNLGKVKSILEEVEEEKVEVKKSCSFAAKDYEGSVNVLKGSKDSRESHANRDIGSFIDYFNNRYSKLKGHLLKHIELKNTRSIKQLKEKSEEKSVSIICIISEINTTKNGNILLEVEDPTGSMTAIIMKDKNIETDHLIVDEVVGLSGSLRSSTFFPDSISFPEFAPIENPVRTKEPLSAVFISDTHIGSNEFLHKVKDRFLKWINDPTSDASNVKYLCIAGDLVDGVGIYPEQKKDLQIKNIYDQYKAFEEFIEKIPEHINIIICPGNHDAVRQAEPQPALDKTLTPNLISFKNVSLVSNPSFFVLHAFDNAPGVSTLMYHGYSFSKIIEAVQYLKGKSAKEPQYVMKEILRKRHLAPKYGSTIFMPDEEDNLIINTMPQIFHTGDLHSFAAEYYKGVFLVSSSTFQGQTAFMDRIGHIANPGKVTVLNLQDGKYYLKDFIAQ